MAPADHIFLCIKYLCPIHLFSSFQLLVLVFLLPLLLPSNIYIALVLVPLSMCLYYTHLSQTTIFYCDWIGIEVKSWLVWSNLVNLREHANAPDTKITKLKWGWSTNVFENVVRKIHEARSRQFHLQSLQSVLPSLSLQNIHTVTSATPAGQVFLPVIHTSLSPSS